LLLNTIKHVSPLQLLVVVDVIKSHLNSIKYLTKLMITRLIQYMFESSQVFLLLPISVSPKTVEIPQPADFFMTPCLLAKVATKGTTDSVCRASRMSIRLIYRTIVLQKCRRLHGDGI
jgi:hypothetical protein